MKNVKKGEVIKKLTSKDKIIYQDEINKNNYTIHLKKSELNYLILSLNIVITDLKNHQNRLYIINEIENIITKLKKADIPAPKDFTSVPTFSTVDLKDLNNDDDDNLDKRSSYSPLIPGMSNSKIDNKTYVTDACLPNQNKEKYEGPLKNGKKEGKGIYYFKSGNRYEGDWKNYKFEGKGIYYSNNGDRYE